MDFNTEIRRTYLGAAPHTLVTSLIWLISGALGQYATKGQAMVFLIVVCTFTFPLGEGLRKLMKAPNLVSKENRLPQLFMLLAFTIPLSYPLIYLVCLSNVNWFFPAFSILVGAHYLPFIYGYRMTAFGFMSGILVIQGTICSLYFSDNFSLSAYITGTTLLAFAFINFRSIKKESI